MLCYMLCFVFVCHHHDAAMLSINVVVIGQDESRARPSPSLGAGWLALLPIHTASKRLVAHIRHIRAQADVLQSSV